MEAGRSMHAAVPQAHAAAVRRSRGWRGLRCTAGFAGGSGRGRRQAGNRPPPHAPPRRCVEDPDAAPVPTQARPWPAPQRRRFPQGTFA